MTLVTPQPDIDLRHLSEDQNVAFDVEYHKPHELERKLGILHRDFGPDGPRTILDIGGGNGTFADKMLLGFPKAEITVLDISAYLLSRNVSNPRKHLVEGSIENIEKLKTHFDLITANWLLHHLVGNSYAECRRNVLETLRLAAGVLTPGGKIVVAENFFDGYFGTNLPSHLIWTITSIRAPWFSRIAIRFFNTAGVGVWFQSEPAWRDIFAKAGLVVTDFWREPAWPVSWKKRLAFAVLGLKPYGKMHFFLESAT